MPKQRFEIVSAPEEPKLTAEELRRLLWCSRKGSEWEIREVTNKKSNQLINLKQQLSLLHRSERFYKSEWVKEKKKEIQKRIKALNVLL